MAVVRRYNDLEHARLMTGTKIGMTGVYWQKTYHIVIFIQRRWKGHIREGGGTLDGHVVVRLSTYLDAHDNYVRCLGAVTIFSLLLPHVHYYNSFHLSLPSSIFQLKTKTEIRMQLASCRILTVV